MIPVLYNHAEKSFTSNGLGRLTDCTSCIVTEERNGVFECEFKYPIFGRHYDEIAEGCIIFVTHDNSGIPQPFDIYKRSVPINGEVTFNAAHVSYRLGKCVCLPFTAGSCTEALTGIQTHTTPECGFLFLTDKSVTNTYEVKAPTAAKALLCGSEGSILDIFGTGEYKFDKFTVWLYLHRGTDTDVQIRYGKNLVDMTDEIDSSGSYTAVVPYWQDAETDSVKMLPERIVFAEDTPIYFDYWTDENGRRISDEDGNEFEFAYSNIVAVTLDLTTEFETEPTDEQMRQKAQASADAHKLYTQSLTVDFVQLAQSEEYKNFAPLQELNLCDTCEVIYNNKPVRVKVVRTEYDVLADRYTQIDLGDPPVNYADVIMGEVADNVPTKSEVASAIKVAGDIIKGVNGGNVVFRYQDGKPYEILIMDTDDVETAVHVLRINMNGIGFSQNGVNGNYTTAWTLDGQFVADFIRTGTLSADLIRTGTLSADRVRTGTLSASDGLSYWNLNNSLLANVGQNSEIHLDQGKFEVYFRDNSATTGTLTKCWSIVPHRDLNNDLRGAVMTAASLNMVALGRTVGSNDYITFCVNNGLTLDGFTEYIIAFSPIRARNGFYIGHTANHNSSSRIEEKTFTYNDNQERFLLVKGEAGIYFTRYSPTYDNIPQKAQDQDCYIVFSPSVYFDSKIYCNGNAYATQFISTSDENLKNIFKYDPTYDDVLDELEPVSFTWREDDTRQHVGLGARHTQRILEKHKIENAGFVGESGGVYGVNYQELSVMLLKRVQDQTKQIKDLSERLERLEALLANS